jgi:hypothetical protein
VVSFTHRPLYPKEKESPVPIGQEFGCVPLWRRPLPGLEPWLSYTLPVALPTELFRLIISLIGENKSITFRVLVIIDHQKAYQTL